MINEQNKNINRKKEIIRNEIETLKLKNTTELKILLDGSNSRFEHGKKQNQLT